MRALRAVDFEHIQILQLIFSKILPSSPGQLEAGTRLPLPSSLVMGSAHFFLQSTTPFRTLTMVGMCQKTGAHHEAGWQGKTSPCLQQARAG